MLASVLESAVFTFKNVYSAQFLSEEIYKSIADAGKYFPLNIYLED